MTPISKTLAEIAKPNIRFVYLYRDGSNWKQFGEVVFANPDGLEPADIEARLRLKFQDGDNFIASQIGVPEVFLYSEAADYDVENPPLGVGPGEYVISEDDHCWHELDSVLASTSGPTDSRTALEFIQEVEAIEKWTETAVKARTVAGIAYNGPHYTTELSDKTKARIAEGARRYLGVKS